MRVSSAIALAASLLLVVPATAQVSGSVVRIGVMNDQSGALSAFSGKGSIEAARMAVEDFGGKVLGVPVEVISADHQNKPDIGAATARKWFDVDGVDVLTDISNSAVSLAVQDIARSKGKIVFHVGSGSDRLYGADCSETGFVWVYDTYTFPHSVGKAFSGSSAGTWFFIVPDYAMGKSAEVEATSVVQAAGGKVLGSVRHPVGTLDFGSYILQAQRSGAKNILLLSAGHDTAETVKQAADFGLKDSGQSLVAYVLYLQTVHSLGLQAAQGMKFVTTFYWDRNDATRAFARRFKERTGQMPSQVHAGMYSSTLAYLRAVTAAGTDEGKVVAAKLKELPVDDFFAEGARVRADGRLMNDVFLAEVKTPAESKGEWDYFKILDRIKAADVMRPLNAGGCALVEK